MEEHVIGKAAEEKRPQYNILDEEQIDVVITNTSQPVIASQPDLALTPTQPVQQENIIVSPPPLSAIDVIQAYWNTVRHVTTERYLQMQIYLRAHETFSAWFVVCASAVAVGFLRGIIGWLIGLGFDLRLWAMKSQSTNFGLVWLVMSLAAAPLAIVAAWLVVYVAPAASGGGVADIKATLNGIDAPTQLFSVRAFIVRCLTIPLSSASGMIIGFEAPMTHMGALVTVIATERLTGIRPHGKHLTDLVSMGTAMGSCAAFITPLCGFLMVREELSLHWDSALSIKTALGCLISAYVARVMRAITTCGFHDFGCVGVGGVIRFPEGFGSTKALLMFEPKEVLGVIIIGIIGGVLGAGISVITWYRGQFVKNRVTPRKVKVAWAGFAVIMACSCYFLIAAFDGCRPLGPNDYTKLLTGTSGLALSLCHAKTSETGYNPAALILFEPRYPAVKSLFAENLGLSEFPLLVLLGSALAVFASMASVLSMQVPFGLVFPHILMGACLGRLVGLLLGIEPGVSALVGVAASLAGLRRTVLPIVVLAVELTGNVTNIMPMVVATLIAKWVGDSLYLRQFDVVIKLKGYPVMSTLNQRTQKLLASVKIKDMMSAPVVSVKAGDTKSNVAALLASSNHQLFPVMAVNSNQRVIGIISRDELQRVLSISQGVDGDTEKEFDITEASLDEPLFINLHASFNKTYASFRNLGLKCMLVLDNDGRMSGIITRTSFVNVMNDPESFVHNNQLN